LEKLLFIILITSSFDCLRDCWVNMYRLGYGGYGKPGFHGQYIFMKKLSRMRPQEVLTDETIFSGYYQFNEAVPLSLPVNITEAELENRNIVTARFFYNRYLCTETKKTCANSIIAE